MEEQDIEKVESHTYGGLQESMTTQEGNDASLPELAEPFSSRSMVVEMDNIAQRLPSSEDYNRP